MENTHSKQLKRALQKIRMPSGQCQACLSDKSVEKDYIITCTLCQSSIHIKHYGREIDETNAALSYDGWKCQRCRLLLQLQMEHKYEDMDKIFCHFCPSQRGILKRVVYNNTQTIWLHPECSTWPYPIVYQKNNKRMHYNCEMPSRPTSRFWINLEHLKQSTCEICKKADGYKIKCMYYTCHKYYHCSCAKSIGFIRDLQSMMFENSDTYIPPYCQDHLQLRIEDCQKKASKYRSAGDEAKASNFSQMMTAYEGQLKNMKKSAQKYRDQEQIRKQMEYQTGEKDELIEQLSFSQNSNNFKSQHDSQFLWEIFDCDYPKPVLKSKKKNSFFFSKVNQSGKPSNDEIASQKGRMSQGNEGAHVQGIEVPGIDIQNYMQQHRRVSARQSEPDYSEWQNSGQLNDEDL